VYLGPKSKTIYVKISLTLL